jgi:hypothetical protein
MERILLVWVWGGFGFPHLNMGIRTFSWINFPWEETEVTYIKKKKKQAGKFEKPEFKFTIT